MGNTPRQRARMVFVDNQKLLEAAGLNELVGALEAITKACVADCGDGRSANPEDPDDLGCVGWDGDGNPLSLTFEMIRAGQAALTGDKSNG